MRNIFLICLMAIFKVATSQDTTLIVRAYPSQECLSEAEDFADWLGFVLNDTIYEAQADSIAQNLFFQHEIMNSGYFVNYTAEGINESSPNAQRAPNPPPPPPIRYFVFNPYFGTLNEVRREDMVSGVQYLEVSGEKTRRLVVIE